MTDDGDLRPSNSTAVKRAQNAPSESIRNVHEPSLTVTFGPLARDAASWVLAVTGAALDANND